VAFAAASKIPGAFFDILFSAAISGAFIPHFAASKKESEQSARAFSSAFFGASLLAGGALALFGALFAPAIISLTSPKIGAEAGALAAQLLRIMFPSAVFTAGAYTLVGILQSRGSFILPAAISSLSNLFIIAYLLAFRADFSVRVLAAVYTASWALQLLALALPLGIKKALPLPKISFASAHFRAALSSVPKIMVGSWLAPASVLISAFFCSFVSEGAFVIYDYASGIYAIISGVAVYAVSSYAFPRLSAKAAGGEKDLFSRELKKALFSVLLITAPVFCGAEVLAHDGITLLYGRGNFSPEAALACAGALRVLLIAMPAFAVSEILYRAFCAAGKTKALALASLFSVGVMAAASAASLYLGGGVFGVCAAFAAAQWAHATFLFTSAKEFFRADKSGKYGAKAALLLPGVALCFAVMSLSAKKIGFFSLFSPSFSIFLKITIVFTLGIVIYLLYVYSFGFLAEKEPRKKRGDIS
jgi:putative peptidoglycan lipid II flippase